MKKAFLLIFVFGLFCTETFAQDEMEMIETVDRLQFQLKEAEQSDERDQIEKQLIELGTFVLDHLQETKTDDPSDYRERVARIRATLEKVVVKTNTEASSLALAAGKMSIDQLLKTIKEQTGNDVVLGREVSLETSEKEVEFKEAGTFEFWDVLEVLTEQANLRIDPYSGEGGQLALSEQYEVFVPPDPEGGADSTKEPVKEIKPMVLADYSGVMRFQVTRVDASRSLLQPAMNSSRLNLQMRWEPRITPIAIEFPYDSIEIQDEFDRTFQSEQEGSHTGIVTPDIPELEFSVGIPLMDRQVEEIKSFKGEVTAVLPGSVETFKFKDISTLEAGTKKTKAGATVMFGGIAKEDDIYLVAIELSFDKDNNALESHQGWVSGNEIYLVDKDGKKIPASNHEQYSAGASTVGFRYIFFDDPAEMDLHYSTPAAIVKVKIPFEILGIPLP
jgi:hypothetical protein